MSDSRIITFGGRLVDPFDLSPEDISIERIAHALSNICRFGGHLASFYSVAQHSVHVAERIEEQFGHEYPRIVLAALLHDASEAYLGDVVRPIKMLSGMDGYRAAEETCQGQIGTHFGVAQLPEFWMWDQIDSADTDLMFLEGMQLGPWDVSKWSSYRKPSFHRLLVALEPRAAKTLFLDYFQYVSALVATEPYSPETDREA